MKRDARCRIALTRYLAFLIIVVTLAHPFHQTFITVAFELNRNFIAANFCENLDQPDLFCEGTCQLRKKLAEAEENQQEETLASLKVETQCTFTQPDLSLSYSYFELGNSPWPKSLQALVDPHVQAIFRPPAFA